MDGHGEGPSNPDPGRCAPSWLEEECEQEPQEHGNPTRVDFRPPPRSGISVTIAAAINMEIAIPQVQQEREIVFQSDQQCMLRAR